MKKAIFRTLFVLLVLVVLFFNINEYLKHTETKAINTYLSAIQNTLSAHALTIKASPALCRGFIKHKCDIESIKIYGANVNLALKNASARITNLSPSAIGVEFSVAKIEHGAGVFPESLTYTLQLRREDSRLGYVALDRALSLGFADFNFAARLGVLLRDEAFKNKNVLFLLKEWFDTATPSFVEYSLDSLDVKIEARGSQIAQGADIAAFISQYRAQNERLFATPKIAAIETSAIEGAVYDLLEGRAKRAALNIKRKNQHLVFFKTLDTESQKKKSLEIAQILHSIDDSYVANLAVE